MSDEFGDAVRVERDKRGWSQARLALEAQTTQPTVDRIEKGKVRFSPAKYTIARVLGLDALLPSPGKSSSQPQVSPAAPEVHFMGRTSTRPSDDLVPVYPAVEGGGGAMLVDREPIDWVPRPEPLQGAKDGYLAYIVNDSMVPAYRPGERAIVHPKLPITPDETYIFYTNDPSDDRAKIKHLVKVTPEEWIVEQYNPAETFAMDRAEWPVAHRVMGKYTRR